jgi:cation transport regulator ChaC
MRWNLFFRTRPRESVFFSRTRDEYEYDDEDGNCRGVVLRVKTAHLTSVICYLLSDT